MSDKNPKKRPKHAKVSLKPELAPSVTATVVKPAAGSQRKPGRK